MALRQKLTAGHHAYISKSNSFECRRTDTELSTESPRSFVYCPFCGTELSNSQRKEG